MFKIQEPSKGKIKQILGYKFIALNDNRVRVVLPNGIANIIRAEAGETEYRRLRAIKYLDKACDCVIEDLGYKKNNIHLTKEDIKSAFCGLLQKYIEDNELHWRGKYIQTSGYKLEMNGVPHDMVLAYAKFIWDYPWRDCNICISELMKINPSKIYIRGEYGIICDKNWEHIVCMNYARRNCILPEFVLLCNIRNEVIHVKKDKYGNILIQKEY